MVKIYRRHCFTDPPAIQQEQTKLGRHKGDFREFHRKVGLENPDQEVSSSQWARHRLT